MKRFLIRFTLFLTPIIIALAVMECFLYNIPNDYQYKSEWYQTSSDSVEVLYLGNSHAYFGLDPQYSSFKSFNGAHVSQDIKRNFLVYKSSQSLSCLNTVVLAISYSTCFENLDKIDERWRVSFYRYYPHSSNSIHNLFITHNTKNNIERLKNYYIHKTPSVYCTKRGAYTQNRVELQDENWKNKAIQTINRHSYSDFSNLPQNRELLDQIIRLKPNTRLILITTPTHKNYYSLLSNRQFRTMQEFISNAVQNNPNVEYHNYMKDPRFGDNDFFDVDHLNQQGAKKLTMIVDSIIKNNPHHY